MDKIEIICMESQAFYKLLEEVLRHFKNNQPQPSDKWISGPEAMKMLRIKSKTTLQKMRDEGHIRFTQPEFAHKYMYNIELQFSWLKKIPPSSRRYCIF